MIDVVNSDIIIVENLFSETNSVRCKMRPGVLTSVFSCVWWVLNNISPLYRSFLALFHFANMTQRTLLLLIHL